MLNSNQNNRQEFDKLSGELDKLAQKTVTPDLTEMNVLDYFKNRQVIPNSQPESSNLLTELYKNEALDKVLDIGSAMARVAKSVRYSVAKQSNEIIEDLLSSFKEFHQLVKFENYACWTGISKEKMQLILERGDYQLLERISVMPPPMFRQFSRSLLIAYSALKANKLMPPLPLLLQSFKSKGFDTPEVQFIMFLQCVCSGYYLSILSSNHAKESPKNLGKMLEKLIDNINKVNLCLAQIATYINKDVDEWEFHHQKVIAFARVTDLSTDSTNRIDSFIKEYSGDEDFKMFSEYELINTLSALEVSESLLLKDSREMISNFFNQATFDFMNRLHNTVISILEQSKAVDMIEAKQLDQLISVRLEERATNRFIFGVDMIVPPLEDRYEKIADKVKAFLNLTQAPASNDKKPWKN